MEMPNGRLEPLPQGTVRTSHNRTIEQKMAFGGEPRQLAIAGGGSVAL
jgi:hypothetical protein